MILWGKEGEGKWQKVGGPCDICGPDGCDHTHMPTGLEQSLEEMEFTRSACTAAQTGELAKLQRMIERNPAAMYHDGSTGRTGYTPLHYAARGGHAECVAFLLRKGAPVEARTTGGATPLMRAAFAGHAAISAALIRARSDVLSQDSDGETALHKAAAQQHKGVLAVLARECPEACKLNNRHGLLPADLVKS